MRVVAILCVRNEEQQIASTLSDLISEGLEIIMIDHDSRDATRERAAQFLGKGLRQINHLPWQGRFSLHQQLEEKQRIIVGLTDDWIVHVDADEWLTSYSPGETLFEGIQRVDRAGYNCIHFNEFVFLPAADDSTVSGNRRMHTRYYFYQPEYPFLIRAWKNGQGLCNTEDAGHLLRGNVRMFPHDFHLRHYIFLSESHALRKYTGRIFEPQEIARGWHRDRIVAFSSNLGFPRDQDGELHVLRHWLSKDLDTSRPRKSHYWQWQSARGIQLPPQASVG